MESCTEIVMRRYFLTEVIFYPALSHKHMSNVNLICLQANKTRSEFTVSKAGADKIIYILDKR